MILSE
jgi:hypothetical protein